MPHPTSKPTDAASDRIWAEHFAANLVHQKPPSGGKTAREVAAMLDRCHSWAKEYCRKGVASGTLSAHRIGVPKGGYVTYYVTAVKKTRVGE
jgi:hypothetical protein